MNGLPPGHGASSDGELFALMRAELSSSVVGDEMDRMGLHHQFLPPQIRPLDGGMIMAGRAMPVLTVDVFVGSLAGTANKLMAKRHGLLFDAIDSLRSEEVYICTGGSPRYALWGELATTRASRLGAAGAILNGFVRDTRAILEQGFGTFCLGSYAQDQGVRGKVVDYRVPIEIGGVRIEPGDLVFGDVDGVCVVPKEAELEAVSLAFERARRESRVLQALQKGMSVSVAYKRFGVM